MRRKDREMGAQFGIQIIDRVRYGILSMVDENNELYLSTQNWFFPSLVDSVAIF